MPLRMSIPLPGPFSYSTRIGGRRRSGGGGFGKAAYWFMFGWWMVPIWFLTKWSAIWTWRALVWLVALSAAGIAMIRQHRSA